MADSRNLAGFLSNCFANASVDLASRAIDHEYRHAIEFRVIDHYPKLLIYRWSRKNNKDLIEIPTLEDNMRILLTMRFIGSFDIIKKCNQFEGAVLVNLNDASHGYGLGFCDNMYFENLIPDSEFIYSNGHKDAIQALTHDSCWADRTDRVFWRGSTTGHHISSDVLDLPRIKLCLLSLQCPEQFDFKITQIVQVDTHDRYHAVANSGILGNPVPWTEWIRHKYHIDIDGNSCSWTGLFYKLASAGVVLKVASPNDFRQWFYTRLKPWHNFVPIKSDLSDLASSLEILRKDQALSIEIGKRGRELALSMPYETEMNAAACTFRNYAKTHP